jgi:hypothetical protein
MSRCPNCDIQCSFNSQYKCENCGELFWTSEELFHKNKKTNNQEEEIEGPCYKPININEISEGEDRLSFFSNHAALSLVEGNSKKTIIYDFIKNGIPKKEAEIIIKNANKIKKKVYRHKGRWELISGVGILTFGTIFTSISYFFTNPGQEFTIAIGAIIVGIITIIHGLYRSIVG